MLTEHQEQVDLINWCNSHADLRLQLIYSHLNGMRSNPNTGRKQKAAGAKKGIPDLFLPVPSGEFHGLYIELKRLKGGTISPEQKIWISLLLKQGYEVVVCKGAEAAKTEIEQYLNI
jgi:VRR-NUC domain